MPIKLYFQKKEKFLGLVLKRLLTQIRDQKTIYNAIYGNIVTAVLIPAYLIKKNQFDEIRISQVR